MHKPRVQLLRLTLIAALGLVALLLVGASPAGAVLVGAPPTSPVPADAPSAPPPIPVLPTAGATPPPADQIADPVTASASCGGWQLESNYGGRWSAGSTWWEYQCSKELHSSYDPCSGGGACDAFCPYCFWETTDWTDYFYWDGAEAVFYGQTYTDSTSWGTGDSSFTNDWWDGPTSRWYSLGPFALTVSTSGTGSGQVNSSPAAISCGVDCQTSFDAGTTVTLTATADPGSTFAGWSGDCSGTGSCQVKIDQARSVTATFAATAFTLTVSRQGSGSGVVSSNPGGISCGSGCQAVFDTGTVVTLIATPDPSSVFTGWSGDCSGSGVCQVAMSQARSVSATFLPKAFTLAVSNQGSGSGQVSSSPVGISCGAGCQASFATGTNVTLTATPGPGSVFAGWSGDCSGSGTCQLTMSQAGAVTATFVPNLPPRAIFTLSCTSLTCRFDAGGSSDPDDAIASYAWSFGDGSSGSGQTTSHTYPKPGSYSVTLTATDNAGASAASSKTFNPISVSARGYKQAGAEKVDLSWNGANGTTFDVYRNGTKIASLQTLSYTDSVNGRGTFTYKVCVPTASTCSNEATVSF